MLDREIRREGFMGFWPNRNRPRADQIKIGDEKVYLIHEGRAANGRSAVLAATKTALWRYMAFEEVGYFKPDTSVDYFVTEGPHTPYFATEGPDTPYFSETPIAGYFTTDNPELEVTYVEAKIAVTLADKTAVYHGGAGATPIQGVALAANDYVLMFGDGVNIGMNGLFKIGVSNYGVAAPEADTFAEVQNIIIKVMEGTYAGKFFALSNGAQQEGDDIDFGEVVSYFDNDPGYWMQIGSGYSANGGRWEAVNVNNETVFNNGVDLPVTYNLNDTLVKPIYELREASVARVGTIAEANGLLVCMDVTLIKADEFLEFFTTDPDAAYGVITDEEILVRVPCRVAWSGTEGANRWAVSIPAAVTAHSRFVTLAYPALSLERGQEVIVLGAGLNGSNLTTTIAFYSVDNGSHASGILTSDGTNVSNGDTVTIGAKTYAFQTTLTDVDGNVEIGASASASLDNLIAAINLGAGAGTAYAASMTANVNVTAVKVGTTQMRVTSISAATSANTVVTTEASTHLAWNDATLYGGRDATNIGTVVLEDEALTTVANTFIARSDTTGSISSYEDLIDDGSAILRGLTLDGWLVIYRDTSIFLARYTGNVLQPFEFDEGRSVGTGALHYRHTLVAVTWNQRTFHIYAGRNSFQRFDLAARSPAEMPLFTLAQDIFYNQVQTAEDDEVFAMHCLPTHEVFFCFPSATEDKALCFDYEWNSLSTTGQAYSCGATVQRPNVRQGVLRQTESWFVAAIPTGRIVVYGRTDEPQAEWGGEKAIWNRDEVPYASVLEAGLSHFGDRMNEKEVTEYLLYLSSFSPETEVNIQFLAAQNPTETPTVIGSRTLDEPRTRNLIPTHFLRYFFADRITVEGKDNPCEVTARTWNVYGVRSESFSRK